MKKIMLAILIALILSGCVTQAPFEQRLAELRVLAGQMGRDNADRMIEKYPGILNAPIEYRGYRQAYIDNTPSRIPQYGGWPTTNTIHIRGQNYNCTTFPNQLGNNTYCN